MGELGPAAEIHGKGPHHAGGHRPAVLLCCHAEASDIPYDHHGYAVSHHWCRAVRRSNTAHSIHIPASVADTFKCGFAIQTHLGLHGATRPLGPTLRTMREGTRARTSRKAALRSEIQSIMEQFSEAGGGPRAEEVMSPRLEIASPMLGGPIQHPPRKSASNLAPSIAPAAYDMQGLRLSSSSPVNLRSKEGDRRVPPARAPKDDTLAGSISTRPSNDSRVSIRLSRLLSSPPAAAAGSPSSSPFCRSTSTAS